MSSLRNKLIRNYLEQTRERADRAPLYDGGECAGVIGVSKGTVATKLGASYDILPPGKRACPYHFHYAQEEMFVILDGCGTLRVAGELIEVRTGDVIAIPPGPQYPHQLINTSDAPLSYLSISTLEFPEVCEYPDSGKYLSFTRVDGPLLQNRRIHRSDTDLDYWDGEA